MAKAAKRSTRLERKFGTDPRDCACSPNSLLPDGIVDVAGMGLESERLADHDGGFATIAAFDFDGTCITGSSPKKLVDMLWGMKMLSLYKLFRIGLWGLAYKLNLPKDAEGVRKRVFSAFAGIPAKKVNEYLCKFYHEYISKRFRIEADAAMQAHLDAGHVVMVVSASFEPIIASAMLEHPIQYALACRMKIDADGNYTREVEGLPTEGPDKLVVMHEFANRLFGEGGWELGWAYGDHYSDLNLLEASEHPCAVTPDGKLRKVAESRNWQILEWE